MENNYKRKKEPEHNRNLILNAALKIGIENDWTSVTFQKISEYTGLSKGGIIHHYKNKEELLDNLIESNLSKLSQWLSDYRKQSNSTNVIRGYLEFNLSNLHNEEYKNIMRLIHQASFVNDKYKNYWKDWCKINLHSEDVENWETSDKIIFLLANGVWFAEILSDSFFNFSNHRELLDYIDNKF